MEAIPEDWITKIFSYMAEWYGDRWTSAFRKAHTEKFMMTLWKNGLMGLTYHEVKYALKLCKRHAEDLGAQPPHVLEFFKYAKGYAQPNINYHPKASQNADPKVASQYLEEIKQKLGMTARLEVYARLAK